MLSTATGIVAAAVVIGTMLLFPWLQKKSIITFRSRSYAITVPGPRDVLLQKSCEALDAASHFSIIEVSDHDFEVKARYRVPPVWADLTISLAPQGTDSTVITATISVLPNLFTVLTIPARRIFARFAAANAQGRCSALEAADRQHASVIATSQPSLRPVLARSRGPARLGRAKERSAPTRRPRASMQSSSSVCVPAHSTFGMHERAVGGHLWDAGKQAQGRSILSSSPPAHGERCGTSEPVDIVGRRPPGAAAAVPDRH